MRSVPKRGGGVIPVSVTSDSLIVVSGITDVLRNNRDIKIVPGRWRTSHGGEDTRRLVLIVDQGSTPAPTSQYLQSLKLRFPNARVLVVGKRCARDELCRLLILGAQGFVAYDELKKSLARAVDALWAGRLWVHPRVLHRLAGRGTEGSSTGAKVGLEALTPRERLVVELLQQRLCNKEISARLNVSEATVKFHLENVFNKLGVHDRHLVADQAALGPLPKRLAA
jgi:DNA-binding NarL/FixJ family response regulator